MMMTQLVIATDDDSQMASLQSGSSIERVVCDSFGDICERTLFWWNNLTAVGGGASTTPSPSILSWEEATRACLLAGGQLPSAVHVKYFLKSFMGREARSFYLAQALESTNDQPRAALGERLCIAIRTRALSSSTAALLRLVRSQPLHSCSAAVNYLVCRRSLTVLNAPPTTGQLNFVKSHVCNANNLLLICIVSS